MITGFNQDVSYKGTVYHVQTEDRGKGNPLIETLIYVGGEIVASRRTSYEDLMNDGYSEARVAALLDQQHKRIVVDIRLGKFSKDEEPPFGEGIITAKSLDEVILEYLTSESEGQKLTVEILDQSPFIFGERGWYRLRAAGDISGTPLEGAEVSVRMASSDGKQDEIFLGRTDGEGLCSASFQVPAVEGSAAVLLTVTHPRGEFHVKALVTRRTEP